MTFKSTFTVRDLNRSPRKVLEAADRLGGVEIRSRDGRVYHISPKLPKANRPAIPDFAARRRAAGMQMMTQEASDALDRLIAGDPL